MKSLVISPTYMPLFMFGRPNNSPPFAILLIGSGMGCLKQILGNGPNVKIAYSLQSAAASIRPSAVLAIVGKVTSS